VSIIVPPDLIDTLAAKVAELISPRAGNGLDGPPPVRWTRRR
jgi:hypothetical protein